MGEPRGGAGSVGLCGTCVFMRVVGSRRGGSFYRCGRADTDARFVRYPRLPLLVCSGFEPGANAAADRRRSEEDGSSPDDGEE